jgi:methionyl-tRNA formyltransferase
VPTLEKLLAAKFDIELVVTNPDEPSGRGYEIKSPPVKRVAERAGIPLYQPAKLRVPETQDFLSRYHPDAFVVVAYGKIIPQWMIDLPKLGCINLHASLLPKYRGAAPIAWAIIQGERVTGVTTMKIDAGMDTGDILLTREEEIQDEDTTESLSERLSVLGADLMLETLLGLERGEITPRPQDHSRATLAPMLKKEHGRIDWMMTADEVSRRVRGLRPWPGAFSTFRGKLFHIWQAAPGASAAPDGAEPGALFVRDGKLGVACGGRSCLNAHEVQLEGRKRISARDFLNGVRLAPGEKLI